MDSEPGSLAHEQVRAAIGVEVARLQREAALDGARWSKWSAIGTIAATVIALVALLVAVL